MKSIKNEKGGILLMALTLLPLFLALMVGFFYLLEVVSIKETLRHDCRLQLINTQKYIRDSIESLQKMNRPAALLHKQKTLVEIKIAAALAAGQYPLALKLGAKLYKIQKKQKVLNISQQTIIKTTFLKTNQNLSRLRNHLSQKMKEKSPQIIKVSLSPEWSHHKGIALVPNRPDPAPEYELPSDFEEKQELVQKWQYSINIISPFSKFLKYSQEFSDQCNVTLKSQNSKRLSIKIKAGKYL